MKHKTPSQVILDQKFWTRFAQTVWEKKPLVLKNVKSDLMTMSDVDIFNLLVSYGDRCRKLKDASGFKFFINGQRTHDQDVLQFLPVRKDKTLLGYHSRMNDIFSDYCLVCDELLTVNSEKQVLLQNFTRDLYQHVGFPNRFSEMGLYLGNYRKTPFGVHVDRCGVFSFPVAGVKKFRLWTSDFVKKNPKLDRAFNYASFKKDSHLITIKPGDMSYWPSSSWHIAESDGSFSATWSLGVWVDKDHQSMFVDTLQDMLKIKLLPQGRLSMTLFEGLSANTGEIRKLPKSFKKSISVLQKLSFVELQEHFIKSWMGHVSKQGMKTQPSVDLKLTLKAQISLRYKHSKILWHASRVQKEKIFLSFGGVFVESSKSSGLFKLVKALNSGESCQLSHYIHDVLKNKDLRSLQKFAVVGAFKIIR